MEYRSSAMSTVFPAKRPQDPLTPLSPSLPTILPHVTDQIPELPVTPPASDSDVETDELLDTAVHVLSTEAMALASLASLYRQDPSARAGLTQAIEQISRTCWNGGKVVISGVGKSGKIADKLVATMNSLGLFSVFLHPIEALHGDLGIVKPVDTLLLITFSGRTPELYQLMQHIPHVIPVITLTSHNSPETSPLIANRPNSTVLPAPIHESEEYSFGCPAPTTSTTVALALGDALALAVAKKMHAAEGRKTRDVFRSHHPGGAIGMMK